MQLPVRNDLAVEYLQSILMLDEETGILRWKFRRASRPAGQQAGRKSPSGYVKVGIDRKTYRAHRIVFALFHGRWPIGEVDHINRIKDDNRPANLRECTRQMNSLNKDVYKNSTTGFNGVGWDKARGLWRASVFRNGKKICLGRFKDKQDAVAKVASVVENERREVMTELCE